MNPSALLKKPIVLILIGLLLAIMFLPFISTGGIFDGFNTTGEEWSKGGFDYKINFDSANIIGSWQSNMDSEQFTITASILVELKIKTENPINYRYAIYMSGSATPIKRYPLDGSWENIPSTITLGQYNLNTWSTKVKTSGNVQLIAVCEVQTKNIWNQLKTYSDPSDLAWDGAYVKSGRGEIYLPANQLGPFEEGSKVNVYVRTGFTGNAGWYVKIYPPADRTDLTQTGTIIKTLSDDTQTYVSWTVPAGAFKAGSSNAWVAELWNNYFDVGFDQILTIDQKDRAPIIKTIVGTNNGNSYTYTVTCEKTFADLAYVEVYAWYGYGGTTMPSTGDSTSWVVYAKQYPVVNGVATFTVEPKNIQGDIVVKFILYDVDGRPGTPDYKSFHVDESGDTEPEPDPHEQPFIWTNTAIMIAVMVAVACMAIGFVAPLDPTKKFALIAVLAAIGAYLVWLAGTLQIGV